VSHRDNRESPGMFATLLLVVPSSSPRELLVRHKVAKSALICGRTTPAEVGFAAFTRCIHRFGVTEGCADLVYNL